MKPPTAFRVDVPPQGPPHSQRVPSTLFPEIRHWVLSRQNIDISWAGRVVLNMASLPPNLGIKLDCDLLALWFNRKASSNFI